MDPKRSVVACVYCIASSRGTCARVLFTPSLIEAGPHPYRSEVNGRLHNSEGL